MMSALYLTNTLFISASSCCLHVPPLGHINLILSQSVFDLAPENCVLSGEAANANKCGSVVDREPWSGLTKTIKLASLPQVW